MKKLFPQPGSRGYTLLVVLIGMAFISSLSLVFVQLGRWQTQLHSLNGDLSQLRQGRRAASSWTKQYLKETLPDSSLITKTVRKDINLPPNLEINIELRSLNGKINLNYLSKTQRAEKFRGLLKSLLEQMNYPDRGVKELSRWMLPEKQRSVLNRGRYSGYDYTAPEREILQLDEVNLMSGFKTIGLKEEFRSIFTVHGTGQLNPLHFTPDMWSRFKEAFDGELPTIPKAALENKKTLRKYLNQADVWNEVSENIKFLTRKDDTFRVTYTLSKNETRSLVEEIYVYNYDKESLKLITRYTPRPTG